MATPQTFRFEEWMLGTETEEEFHAAMVQHYADRYEGLSMPLIGRDALFEMEEPRWALENLIQAGGFTLLHGDPGSGKSFLAMEWAYALAHPDLTSWLGQKKDRVYKPMYLFTEGVSSLRKRTRAWELENDTLAPDIVVVRDPVRMNPKEGISLQLSSLAKLYVDQECDLLIVDTLANTFVGNENQQEDANRYMQTIRQFQEWGPVVVVHHNKRSDDEYRGSSVFHGAADTMVLMKKSEHNVFDLKVTKQKDGDPDFRMALVQKKHTWPRRDESDYGFNPFDEVGSVAFSRDQERTRVAASMTAHQLEVYEAVLNHGGTVRLAELARQLGKDKGNLKTTILKIENLEVFSPGGNSPVVVRVVREEEAEEL